MKAITKFKLHWLIAGVLLVTGQILCHIAVRASWDGGWQTHLWVPGFIALGWGIIFAHRSFDVGPWEK